MAHLYTLTGNLLAETTATYKEIFPGGTFRAEREQFQVGGKGINVAKMAQRLGLSSTAVCFPGGRSGERCVDWLRAQPFATKPFPQVAETREGWVVRDGGGRETTYFGRDRELEEEPWAAAMKYLGNGLKAGDIFAVCGSLPGWRPVLADSLGRLLDEVAENVFVAVDTYGPALADLLGHPIDLVKINRSELEGVLPPGVAGGNLAEVLVQFGRDHPEVKRWVITGGRGPVIGFERGKGPFQRTPPRVEEVSATGSGDVLLAGLLRSLVENSSLEEAIECAIPLAAANAASPGVANFDLP